MFGFLKKLFGGDAETNKAAGVQIEQVPYKVEKPEVVPVSYSDVPVLVDKVVKVNSQPVEKSVAAEPKPAAITAAKKPAARKTSAKKPAAKKAPAKKKAAK